MSMKPLVIGHRGSPLEAPENTLLSIQKAVDTGIDGVEIDVRLSKDGEIVVIHDDSVRRVSNGKGSVKRMSLGELKQLDLGEGQKIPTLCEVLEYFRDKTTLVIEVKEEGFEEKLVEIIKRNKAEGKVFVISFIHESVKKVKELDGKINTGALLVGNPADPASVLERAGAGFVFASYKYVEKKFVGKLHEKNHKVFVWNVDDEKGVDKMLSLEVDGICTNKPGLVVNHLNKKSR